MRKAARHRLSPLLICWLTLLTPIDRRVTAHARFARMLPDDTTKSCAPAKTAHHVLSVTRIAKRLCAATVLTAASCGGSLYKVKPVGNLPALPASAALVNIGSVSFRAAPLLTDEESQELFESNLQLAGLLPVRIEIVHNSGDAIELKKVRFHLDDSTGVSWKAVSARQAIARILKANGVFAYNPNSRKTFEKEFRAYELDLNSPLTHAEHRRGGFLFFQPPKKDPVASPRGLVLSIDGLPQPITLSLN
jgi:hypothetical protein